MRSDAALHEKGVSETNCCSKLIEIGNNDANHMKMWPGFDLRFLFLNP
jgi:hypothetical protein